MPYSRTVRLGRCSMKHIPSQAALFPCPHQPCLPGEQEAVAQPQRGHVASTYLRTFQRPTLDQQTALWASTAISRAETDQSRVPARTRHRPQRGHRLQPSASWQARRPDLKASLKSILTKPSVAGHPGMTLCNQSRCRTDQRPHLWACASNAIQPGCSAKLPK